VRPLVSGDPARLGRFELLGRIGEGGQGIVYLGRGTGPGEERVAVKVLRSVADATTITSGLIGTPSYVAPELLAGRRPTSAVDIFAWALTMIYASTGRLAFGGDTVEAVIYRILYEEPDLSGLPPSLRPVIEQCLSKDPRQRPTARDLLLRLVDPSLQAGFPASGRKLFLAAGGGVAALVLVAGAALYLTRGSPPAHAGPGSTAVAKVTDTAGFGEASASSAAAKTPAATGAAIPAAFAGTWVSIDGPGTFTFTAGARTAKENMRGCVGNLNLKQVRETGDILIFTSPVSRGCSPGSVWCTLIGGTLIDYQWQNQAGLAAAIQLRRA